MTAGVETGQQQMSKIRGICNFNCDLDGKFTSCPLLLQSDRHRASRCNCTGLVNDTLYAAEDSSQTSSLAMQISCSADDFVQQLAATLQPTVPLHLWGQISAALLRTGQHDLTAVIQSLLTASTKSRSQVLHAFCVSTGLSGRYWYPLTG